eukprot:UN10881
MKSSVPCQLRNLTVVGLIFPNFPYISLRFSLLSGIKFVWFQIIFI